MMEFKHTPGPWYAGEFGNVWGCVHLDGHTNKLGFTRKIAMVSSHLFSKDQSRHDGAGSKVEVDANTRLISAAPNLLLALQAYMKAFESHQITNHSGATVDTTGLIAEFARQAIAKATEQEIGSGT